MHRLHKAKSKSAGIKSIFQEGSDYTVMQTCILRMIILCYISAKIRLKNYVFL